jgi:thymidylate synthase (FAD)
MKVSLVHVTPDAEKHIAYCARVSSPNQENPEYEKLLAYCVRNAHWSVFEMASMCLEITTSRAISAQILRHRSFNFQEFSQRYAEATEYVIHTARRRDEKNRQNSIDDMSPEVQDWFLRAQVDVLTVADQHYRQAIEMGIAKESARMLLPLSTQTRLYMHGTVRSWIHYIQVRTDNSAQLEHREIAEQCKSIFCEQLPTVAKALQWAKPDESVIPNSNSLEAKTND